MGNKNSSIAKGNQSDDFIIKHFQKIKHKHITTDINKLDSRRFVFVSLVGLFQSWKNIPSHVLYPSFVILPLKSKWIYEPSKYSSELEENVISQISMFISDMAEMVEFIKLIKWKDSQTLVFWMLDEFDVQEPANANPLIQSFWFDINQRLVQLYDPITANNYKPINLNMKWWTSQDLSTRKYNTKASSIMNEFYFLTMKYDSLCEIIYQSNPESLIPVKVYSNNVMGINGFFEIDESMEETDATTVETPDEFDDADSDQKWFISTEYNPYQMANELDDGYD